MIENGDPLPQCRGNHRLGEEKRHQGGCSITVWEWKVEGWMWLPWIMPWLRSAQNHDGATCESFKQATSSEVLGGLCEVSHVQWWHGITGYYWLVLWNISLSPSLSLYIPPIFTLFSVIISILQIFCHGALQPPAPKKISDRFQSWRPWMNSARTSLRRSPDVTGSTKTQYTIHPFSRILAEFFF